MTATLNSFQADASFPKNLNHTLETREALTFVEHLSNYLRLIKIVPKFIKIIKCLPIFTEVDHTSAVRLLPGNKEWFLLPKDEENSYGKIIYPSDKGGFLSTSLPNLRYILEDIIEIPRLTLYDYWRNYVIPFLESQPPNVIDTVVDKLFDRLPSLLDKDAKLKDSLGKIPFVPVGTLRMSQQKQMPEVINLVKPTELFDPEERSIVDLFFKD